MMGYRHVLRNTSMLGTHITALCDNLGLTLAVSKGRGRAFEANRTCWKILALSMFAGSTLHVRWVPSELNPADAPSRRWDNVGTERLIQYEESRGRTRASSSHLAVQRLRQAARERERASVQLGRSSSDGGTSEKIFWSEEAQHPLRI